MKTLSAFRVAAAAFFVVLSSVAMAQNSGTVTSHAFVLGKGPGVQGFTSLLCGSAQLAVGQSAADPICQTITGDVTISAVGVTAIGASKVTNTMLTGPVSVAKGGAGQTSISAMLDAAFGSTQEHSISQCYCLDCSCSRIERSASFVRRLGRKSIMDHCNGYRHGYERHVLWLCHYGSRNMRYRCNKVGSTDWNIRYRSRHAAAPAGSR